MPQSQAEIQERPGPGPGIAVPAARQNEAKAQAQALAQRAAQAKAKDKGETDPFADTDEDADVAEGDEQGGDEQDQRVANNVEQMLRRAERPYSNNPNAKIGDGSLWRPWEIQTPALTRTHQAAVRALRRGNSTEGLYVTRPERWSVDGAIFGRPSRAFGASLLIDVSGSMHLTPEQVDEIIAKAPAAVIATYTSNGVRGVICVIAKNGRRVGDAEELHSWDSKRGSEP